MRDVRKPLAFGRVLNIEPVFVEGMYWANDGRCDSVQFYVGGVPLIQPIADAPNIASLKKLAVPAGEYATCEAYGAIKFGVGAVEKLVTADVVSTSAGYLLSRGVQNEVLFDRAIKRGEKLSRGDQNELLRLINAFYSDEPTEVMGREGSWRIDVYTRNASFVRGEIRILVSGERVP